jgi:hypothetical protein
MVRVEDLQNLGFGLEEVPSFGDFASSHSKSMS